MNSCSHEEADTRVAVHVVHALQQGLKTVQVCTVDTEVIVILAGQFHDLLAIQLLADIWIAFGMEKTSDFITLMLSVQALESASPEHCPFSCVFWV